MLPIPPVLLEHLMRPRLIGAFISDPVVRDRPHRPPTPVHFHSFTDDRPEICYEADCSRPRLQMGF
jgi:hypothetical protein